MLNFDRVEFTNWAMLALVLGGVVWIGRDIFWGDLVWAWRKLIGRDDAE